MTPDMDTAISHAAQANGDVPSWRNLLEDGLRVRSTRDRITRALPDREWLWHGYIVARQLVLLHADGGLYKSVTAAALVAQHTQPAGGWLLGRPVAAGSAVYLDAENDDDDIDDRLRRLGVAADNDRLVYHGIDEGLLGRAQQSGDLLELLGGVITDARATLLVIDSLASAWGLPEKEQDLLQALLNTLNQARRVYGCTIVLIHHDRRGGDFRGFGNLHNSVQSRLHIKPAKAGDEDEPATEVVLDHPKQRSGAKQRPLAYAVNWDAFRVTLSPTSEEIGKVEQVVRYVQMCDQLVPTTELRNRFKLSKNFFFNNASVLHAAGIERDREDEPRQSRGWQPIADPNRSPKRSPGNDLSEGSVNHAGSRPFPQPTGNAGDRSTMRDSAVPPSLPLRGDGEPPAGERNAAGADDADVAIDHDLDTDQPDDEPL